MSDLACTLAALFVHPVKSCAGIALDEALLVETGLDLDRAWMVVDEHGAIEGIVTSADVLQAIALSARIAVTATAGNGRLTFDPPLTLTAGGPELVLTQA